MACLNCGGIASGSAEVPQHPSKPHSPKSLGRSHLPVPFLEVPSSGQHRTVAFSSRPWKDAAVAKRGCARLGGRKHEFVEKSGEQPAPPSPAGAGAAARDPPAEPGPGPPPGAPLRAGTAALHARPRRPPYCGATQTCYTGTNSSSCRRRPAPAGAGRRGLRRPSLPRGRRRGGWGPVRGDCRQNPRR